MPSSDQALHRCGYCVWAKGGGGNASADKRNMPAQHRKHFHFYALAQTPSQRIRLLPPMPPQCQGQGHPQKERRGRQKTQTCSPNPGPSHLHITHPSDDIGRLSDEVIESVDVVDDLEINLDTRVPAKWDPHAGMKPSQGDNGASNRELELEDNLPYGGTIEVSRPMVKMMAALGNNDNISKIQHSLL